jgi:putative integral membrane protein (TIGR02587 family)
VTRVDPDALRPVGVSLKEYGRGLAGGLLFSLPMLYTQEMWRAGGLLGPERLLVGMLGAFLMLLGYNRYAGLRCDAGLLEVVIDSVEELGLGLALAALLLIALGGLDLSMSLEEQLGRVLVCGLAVAIGVSVGTAQLGGGDEDEEGMTDDDGRPAGFTGQLVLAICGAVLVAANIAPTDEIPEIAGTMTPVALLCLSGLTLAVAAMVLHFSEFVGASTHTLRRNDSDVVTGILATYLVSLAAAAALLWFFGRFSGDSPGECLAQVVVLGLPTAIGASAGRLLLQQQRP